MYEKVNQNNEHTYYEESEKWYSWGYSKSRLRAHDGRKSFLYSVRMQWQKYKEEFTQVMEYTQFLLYSHKKALVAKKH
jgi:hypothetical protein